MAQKNLLTRRGTAEAEKQEPQEEESYGGTAEVEPKVTTDELLESKLKDLISELLVRITMSKFLK